MLIQSLKILQQSSKQAAYIHSCPPLLVFLWVKSSLSDLLKGIVQITKVGVGVGACVFHLLTWFGSHEASLEFSDDLGHKTTDSCFSFVLI